MNEMAGKLTKDELLEMLSREHCDMTLRQKLRLTALLSVPSIIAQLSFILMSMIDAAMLGHLSTNHAAAVGLVSTTIWLFAGFISAFASGFSVQVAHRMGARDVRRARRITRQGIMAGIIFSIALALTGLAISPFLPGWLGASQHICHNATLYLAIYSVGIPFVLLNTLAAGCLRCSGNIKVPSALMVQLCALDVVFNYLFIFVLDLGTAGAALGTMLAYVVTMVYMMLYMTKRDRNLRFSHDRYGTIGSRWRSHRFKGLITPYYPTRTTLIEALRIGFPISIERGLLSTAQIAISAIIAPMGSIAIAANTFAINVESLCYMPGYGVAEASTTLVGQSKGARRSDLMRSFAWIAMAVGMGIMSVMGLIMWVFAPQMMGIITPDTQVIDLGAEVLRIEAWAEPGFAAAIVGYSVFIGAGTSFVPSIMNLCSIWLVRVTLTLMLASTMGLHGVWIAMAIELGVRGSIYIVRLLRYNWNKHS